ncbi:MAG: hypothetical protein Ct9H300mP11_18900 [Chloroflexota bacterium]|nr:MAG: hypothetical protein Ct9H300mP11_18900 [Chloroflexota bacterium]
MQAFFGPGYRANATIGRALRLAIRNIGKCIPGAMDKATQSTPGRYSFCFAENEDRFTMGTTSGHFRISVECECGHCGGDSRGP